MNSNNILLMIILLVACLSQFASDIYTPALPAIAANLHSTISLAQLSLTIYLFGVAFSLLAYGVASEIYGRKYPLIIGLIIMLSGSVICSFSQHIQSLIIGRFIQGLGAGACAGLWRAIFRDLFTGEQLAKYGSYFTIFIMFIVPAAPAIGGSLQHFLGWRSVFVFMCLYIALTLILVCLCFRETNQHYHQDKRKLAFISSAFRQLLSDKTFMSITLCTFLSYGAFFSWFTAGPILLIHHLNMSPITFGWISCIGGGAAYALAGRLNGKLVTRVGMHLMMRFGWITMIISGILMLVGNFIFGMNIIAILIPAILFYFGSTFIWPNAFALAMTPFGKIAGYAGALYSFMQLSGGAVIGLIISNLPTTNQIPLALIFIIASSLAWAVKEKGFR